MGHNSPYPIPMLFPGCRMLQKRLRHYCQEYLSLLARTGRLEAVKRGRNWVTTRAAVAAYRASVG